jgi:hypothetical protein
LQQLARSLNLEPQSIIAKRHEKHGNTLIPRELGGRSAGIKNSLILVVRTNPKPDDFVAVLKNAHCTVTQPYSHGHEPITSVHAFEMKARMPRVSLE